MVENTDDLNSKMLSLSNISLELLPAFGPIEQGIILFCKVETGKMTMEEVKKKLGAQ